MKKRYLISAINDNGKSVSLVEDAYSMGDCEQKVLNCADIKCITNISLLGLFIDGVYFKIDLSSNE